LRSVSRCLSVRLYVSETTCPNFTNFLCMSLVAIARSSSDYSLQCIRYFRFCGRRPIFIGRSVELLPRTLLTTVAFCQTLVVAQCGPSQMSSCRAHIINLMRGASRPPVIECGTTFHLKVVPHSMTETSTRTTAAGTLLLSLQTISENSYFGD